MDCTVCTVRSSTNYCIECQTLLCEECGALCDECRKRMCPQHIHETRHGRTLCFTCYAKYTDNRRRREAEADGVDLEPPVMEHHARLKRTGEPLRPWVASLCVSLAGAAGIGLLLIVPSLRQIDFGAGRGLPSAYIVLVLPLLAIAWAFLGLLTRRSRGAKLLNLIGLSIAAATIALTFLAVRPQAAHINLNFSEEATAEDSAIEGSERDKLTRDQLKDWRKDKLNQYEGENAPKAAAKKTLDLQEVLPTPASR